MTSIRKFLLASTLILGFAPGMAGAKTLKKIRIGYPSLSFRQQTDDFGQTCGGFLWRG